MKILRSLIIVFTFLILVSLCFGFTDYTQVGSNNSRYTLGQGQFIQELDTETYTLAISNLQKTPLVDDIDNPPDGINEIILFASDTIYLYNKDTDGLTLKGSLDTGTGTAFSNLISFDINGDGVKELIIVDETHSEIIIYQWNTTHLTNISDFTLTGWGLTNGQTVLACISTNKCGVGINAWNTIGAKPYMITSFNTSEPVNAAQVFSPGASQGICQPNIRQATFVDWDIDGIDEFIVSAIVMDNAGDEEHIFISAEIDSDLSVTLEYAVELDTADLMTTPVLCTTAGLGKHISPPTIADVKDEAGLETIIAYSTDTDKYKMRIITSDGDIDIGDVFPQTLSNLGIMVSNIYISNTFSETGLEDFCVNALDSPNDIFTMTCSSKRRGFLKLETHTFDWEITVNRNISTDYDSHNIISHATNQDNNENQYEMISSFGLFRGDFDSCTLGLCDLELLKINQFGDAVVLSVDVEKSGSEDFLIMTENNFYYLDDNLQNTPAYISNIRYDPCPDGYFIKVNETIEVYVTVNDDISSVYDPDPVNANVSIYYGTDNVQVQEVLGASTGQEIPFVFVHGLNQTGVARRIRISAWDDANPDVVETQTDLFTVATEGILNGDVECDFSFTPPDEIEGEIIDVLDDGTLVYNNTITNAMGTMTQLTGIGTTLTWLFIMIMSALGIFAYGSTHHHMNVTMILITVEVGLIIMGTLLGFIGLGILITFIILALIGVGLWLRKVFMGHGQPTQ